MNKTWLLFLMCLLAPAYWLSAAENSSGTIDKQKLAGELSQRFRESGSFEADYRAVAPGKNPPLGITLLFSDQQKYSMIKLTQGGEKKTGYVVLDSSEMLQKNPSYEILMIAGSKGSKCKISIKDFDDMIERPDNPFGIMGFMLKQFALRANLASKSVSDGPLMPIFSLGLTQTDLVASAGMGFGPSTFNASWLGEEALTNAAKVIESPDTVQWFYPEDHTIVIDRKTGLLQKDSWPNPAHPGPREIELNAHSAFSGLPYPSLIPGFNKIMFKEIPSKEIYWQLCVAWLTDQGRKASAMTNFDELLRTHSIEIAAVVREMARELERTNISAKIDKRWAIRFRDKFLLPQYKEFAREHPNEAKNVTFPKFVDELLAWCETDPGKLVPPEAAKLVEKRKKQLSGIFSLLPNDARKPLMKLYDIFFPAVAEGVQLEFASQGLRQVRALDTP